VVSGTIIVLIVFSPLLTLSGLEGKLFTPVALTIVFAMFSALILSLTVVPVIASFLVNEDAAKMPRLRAKPEKDHAKASVPARHIFLTPAREYAAVCGHW
jgi:Cu/Ag efflux pump CusA